VTADGIAQIVLYLVILTVLAYPLGAYMARVYGGTLRMPRWLGAPERGFYRLVGTSQAEEQGWKEYAKVALVFMAAFAVLLYLVLRLQGHLPFNPNGLKGVSPWVSINTTASFVTNTNWQYYGGETTMSYLSQMAGLAVQDFVSAGLGMAVLAAVVRGFARRSTGTIGNFWVDLYRSIAYILLPLAVVLTVILMSQGVVQTLDGNATATTVEGARQTIARGPVASQVAIKQLGTNGGGFYNSNSAVPFENPSTFTNLVEMLAILLIPVAQVFMFGRMVGSRRQALPVYTAMLVMTVIGLAVALPAEQHGSQVLRASGVSLAAGAGSSGGNMSDKEVRNGIASTVTWAVATSDASNGSVNGGHDALTATGGAVPILNIFTGEVIWGGVGSGLYGMFFYIVIAVFVAGLMVGRTPEYLGKKIEAREIKLAAVGALFVPTMVLVLTAIAIVSPKGLASIYNHVLPAHGFSETLYAYDSQANNNGSAFAGYGATELSPWVERSRPRTRFRPPRGRSAPTARRSRSSWSAW
jgi:K+-transporting ATPase ATPase A chain